MSMTESEAKLFDSLMNHNSPYYGYELCKGEIKTILQGFEELKQYRAIGTVSEFRELKEKARAKESYGIKCPHCNFYTSNGRYCCNCGKMLIAKSEGKE